MLSNLFTELRGLFPQPVVRIAEVLDTDGTTSLVSFPGDITANVRGTASVGDQVYVYADAIQGVAPTQPTYIIDID